jgi:outer membrane protein TolC
MHRRVFLIIFLCCLALAAYSQTRDLDFYLNEAVRNSPLLNDYRNQINQAGTDSLIIGATRKPFIEAKSSLLYSPYYHNFGYDDVITDGGNYTAVLGVSQNIFNKKAVNNRYAAVEIQKRSVNNSTKISTNELKKIITDQYLTAFSDYSDYIFNKNFLELFLKENEILKQFVKNGVVKQTDYLSFLVESQTQEILVNQIKNQYVKDLLTLSQLCGINDTSWYELSEPDLQIHGSPEIGKSPSFIQYKIDSIRIENEKLAIDIQYKPKINWFADAGFLTSNPWNFYRHFGYSAGVSLNIPVYDGKQKTLSKQKLEFDENSRKGYENNFSKQYFQQVQQLDIELKSLNEMSVRISNQLKTSEQLVTALKDQLEAGNIQMTEYINAVKNFKTASRNINLINIQKLQVINQMNFLLTQ